MSERDQPLSDKPCESVTAPIAWHVVNCRGEPVRWLHSQYTDPATFADPSHDLCIADAQHVEGFPHRWEALYRHPAVTRSAGALPGVECLKAVDALTVERAEELAEWAEQQVRIDEKMPQDMARKSFQARMRGISAACTIAREYLRVRATHSASERRKGPVDRRENDPLAPNAPYRRTNAGRRSGDAERRSAMLRPTDRNVDHG